MTHSAPHTTGPQTNIDYQFEIYVFSAPVTKIYLYFINWWLRFVKFFFVCVYARSLYHFPICVYAFLLCLGYGVAVWRCVETNVSISLISYYSPSFEYKCLIFIVVSFAYIGIKYFYLILWLFFPLIVSIHYNHWTVVNKRLNTSLIWCIQKAHTHTHVLVWLSFGMKRLDNHFIGSIVSCANAIYVWENLFLIDRHFLSDIYFNVYQN